jgi:3-isopropylmalate/(R)-2-methylmalate dehydratase small subunit
MEKFINFSSKIVPLDVENIDTDQIIPARFLTSTTNSGYSDALFNDWRKNADFVLNQPQYKDARILLTKKNFGCGSSREHAAWALRDYGFKAVLAPSFGDIFRMNALKNGLLIIQLAQEQIDALFAEQAQNTELEVTLDLVNQTIKYGPTIVSFEIDPFRKLCMVNGYDDLEYMVSKMDKIKAYEQKYSK